MTYLERNDPRDEEARVKDQLQQWAIAQCGARVAIQGTRIHMMNKDYFGTANKLKETVHE